MLQNTKACMYKAMMLINNCMVNHTEINYTTTTSNTTFRSALFCLNQVLCKHISHTCLEEFSLDELIDPFSSASTQHSVIKIQTGFQIHWRESVWSVVCSAAEPWPWLLGFSCKWTVDPAASFPHCPVGGASWGHRPSIPASGSSILHQTQLTFLDVVLHEKNKIIKICQLSNC